MRYLAVVVLGTWGLLLGACASTSSMGPDAAQKQVQQLLTLYKENRAKFVLQKEKLIKDEDCGRATALREAAVKMEEEANMQPEPSDDITKLSMELKEAEKLCLEK